MAKLTLTAIDFKAAQADGKLEGATCSRSALTRTSAIPISANLREYPYTCQVYLFQSIFQTQGKIK